MSEIGQEDRWEEVNNAILRVIRMDRKYSSFDLIDETNRCRVKLKVKYGQAGSQPSDQGEHAMRAYWRHLSNFYFKKIDDHDLARLDFLQGLTNLQEFAPISHIIQPISQRSGKHARKDYENLLKHIKIQLNEQLNTKQKQSVEKLRDLIPKSKGKFYQRQLDKETHQLDQFLEYTQSDEISSQLERLEEELGTLNSSNRLAVDDLRSKAELEVKTKQLLYNINTPKDIQAQQFVRSKPKLEKKLQSLNNKKSELMCSFLKGFILKLERSQVADSIVKILNTQKSINGGNKAQIADYIYKVSFEQALNVGTYQLTEAQLLKLNSIRQVSLLKFYNTALKSPYTHVSHNFAGFGHIVRNRTVKNILKNSDMIDTMRKASKQNSVVMNTFNQFESCHHCKQLFPRSLLNDCRYRSAKTPNLAMSFDSDNFLLEDSEDTSSGTTSRCMRKKQGYLSYTKKGDEYVCLRKFCRNCISQYYEQVYAGELCPFCQSSCFCTRCQRNQTINKLKRLYVAYGGDLSNIQNQSLLEKIFTANEEPNSFLAMNRQKTRFRNITDKTLNDNRLELFDKKIERNQKIEKQKICQKRQDSLLCVRSYRQLEDKENALQEYGEQPRKLKKLR